MTVVMQKGSQKEKTVEFYVLGNSIAISDKSSMTRISLSMEQWQLLSDVAQRKANGEDF